MSTKKRSSEEVFRDIIEFGGTNGKRIVQDLPAIDPVVLEGRRQSTKSIDDQDNGKFNGMILRSHIKTQKM